MTVVIFLIILSLLIIVHECGHFWIARKLGVRVEEFALGFGPKIFGWKDRLGTEYRLCAILLGGYVKMAGDERGALTGAKDEFFSKPVGHRALIAVFGPAVNFILAYLCFVVVFTLGFVDLPASQKQIPPQVGIVQESSPAEKAGIQSGDLFLSIDNRPIENWVDIQQSISMSKKETVWVEIQREGAILSLSVNPEEKETKDIFGRKHSVIRIGVQPVTLDQKMPLVIRKYSFLTSFQVAAKELFTITMRTYTSLWEIIIGKRSVKEGMTGLVGIFFIVKFALGIGFAFLLHIVGVISASLAIFNLLPIIPLDGGHILLLALEKVRGRPLSEKTDEILSKIGFALFIALALFVFFLDFERIGLFDKIINFFKK